MYISRADMASCVMCICICLLAQAVLDIKPMGQVIYDVYYVHVCVHDSSPSTTQARPFLFFSFLSFSLANRAWRISIKVLCDELLHSLCHGLQLICQLGNRSTPSRRVHGLCLLRCHNKASERDRNAYWFIDKLDR